jgi:RimJ/RimL family protein N-acetyltransferase
MIKFRPIEKGDQPYCVKWLNNPRVNALLGNEEHKKVTLRQRQKWFADYLKSKDRKFFTICDSAAPIGFMGLKNINLKNKNAELFIAIGEDDYRGKGIGTKATRWLVDFGFRRLELHKIFLGVIAENKLAINCYKDSGFKIEGRLKDDLLSDGKWHDMILMAIFNKGNRRIKA